MMHAPAVGPSRCVIIDARKKDKSALSEMQVFVPAEQPALHELREWSRSDLEAELRSRFLRAGRGAVETQYEHST